MCKGSQTTSTTSAPNPQAGAAYSSILQQAQNVAATPYQPYTGELVAPVNAQQQAGISNINNYAEAAQPTMNLALDYGIAGATPITSQQIQQYSSPYTQAVVNATQAQFNNQNAQQQAGVIGNAVAQGALGGNRVGIAQSELANQQQLAQAPVIAGLENQGYTTGLNTALTEQQAQEQGAYGLANIGVAGENAALTGANAQVGAGTLEQQTQQAQDAALYQQYLNQMAYPFQTTQWLAGIDTGVGSQMGGTSSTTGPAPSLTSQLGGLGLAGLGLFGSSGAISGLGSLATSAGNALGSLLIPAGLGLKHGGSVDNGVAGHHTIPESPETIVLQRLQLMAGHRKAQMFPKGTPEPSVPQGAKRAETSHGVFHFNPSKISAEEIKKLSEAGRENEILDLGPYSKDDIVKRIHGGEIPVAIVERSPHGIEARAALGTHATAHHQIAAMDRTKSPGHSIYIEDPRHTIARRFARANGGVANRDVGGATNYTQFGGGYGSAVMPYAGGKSFIPSIGIVHGHGAPNPPPDLSKQNNQSIGDQAKQIGQIYNLLSGNKNQGQSNGPVNVVPSGGSFQPSTNTIQSGTAPETFSPLNGDGGISGNAIYASGGVVPFPGLPRRNRIVLPKTFADGGGDDPNPVWMGSTDYPPSAGAPDTSIRDSVIAHAQANGIDPGFALRQFNQESGLHQYDDNGNVVTSKAGAIGVGQLMPDTARDLGVDPYDTEQNINGALKYDRQLLDKYGNYPAVAAAYNAGPNRYDAYLRGDQPLPAETANYVPRLTGTTMPVHRGASYAASPDTVPDAAPANGVAPSSGIDFSSNSKLWPALTAAGFAMMASRSPFPGVAIGEGGLTGLETYAGEVAQEREGKLSQSKLDLEGRKLSQEADQERRKLDEEAQYHAGDLGIKQSDLALRQQELNKPIQMKDPFGGSYLVARDPNAPGGWRRIDVQGATPGTSALGGDGPPGPSGTPLSADQSDAAIPAKATYVVNSENPNGEAQIAGLPENEKALIRGIAAGNLPTGPYLVARNPELMAWVERYDPSFTYGTAAARAAAQKNFGASGIEARNFQSNDMAIKHIGTAFDNIEAMGNLTNFGSQSGLVNLNTPYNMWRASSDPAFQEANKRLGVDIDAIGSELMRSFRGSGTASEKEAMEWRDKFPVNGSPVEQRAALSEAAKLLASRIEASGDFYNKVMGPYYSRDPKSWLSNDGRDTLDFATSLDAQKPVPKNWRQQVRAAREGGPSQNDTQEKRAKIDPAQRFKQLIDSGMTKDQAYSKMHEEGY